MSAPKTTKKMRGDRHQNEGASGKYYHQMLNMADDDLGPFEYRLLGHYIRVCGAEEGGVCYQTVRTIAEITKMSIPKVIAARKELAKNGWIRVEARANKTHNVTIVDRMAENVKRYSVQNIERESVEDVSDQNIDRGDQNIDRGDQYPANKEEPNKKNQKEQPEQDQELAPAAQESPEPTEPPKPLTPHQLMFGAVCNAWGYKLDALTKTKRGQINSVVGELVDTNATPDDIPAFKAWLDEKARADEWRSYTVSAMAKYWADFEKEYHAPPPAPVRWDYGDVTQDMIQDEIVARFRAKLATPGAFDDSLTPEERSAQEPAA